MNAYATQQLDLPRLHGLLDEAELERTRLNRRIRLIRETIKVVEAGDPLPDIGQTLDQLLPAPVLAPVEPAAPAAPAALAWAPPAPPSAPASPFAGRLGDGMPPGVPSPMAVPPAGPPLAMPSVDVGLLGRMTPEALDSLPFGVVTLDATGRIIGYNDTESRMAGLPRDAVVGRNFFADVAPCARVREFEGRFRDFTGGRSRLALETFEFVFHFRHGAQRVVIFVSPARLRGQFHVSMIRR